MANTAILYSDFRNDFAISPITNDLMLVTNADSVKQAIQNLCLTAYYEHFGKPQFGAGLASYLFENPSPITQDVIKSAIISAINNYDRRISELKVDVNVNNDANGYTATITFMIQNVERPVTFDVILQRIR